MNNLHGDKSSTNFEIEIKELKNDSATLIFDNALVSLPQKRLPKNIQAGDKLIITISTKDGFLKNKDVTAKEILNELLKSPNNTDN